MGSIGLIANPVSGKDVRRLLAAAPTSTLQEKYSIVRRLYIGAAEVGVTDFKVLAEPHHICLRAAETLELDLDIERVEIELRYDETDTVRTAQRMQEQGCEVLVVLGGDGTSRAVTRGWRDATIIPISTGTNNVFPDFVEATVAGAAAGLVASGQLERDRVATRAKIVDIDIEGEANDIALIDAVFVDERNVGSRALFAPADLRAAVFTRAEPAAVGLSSIGGLLAPASKSDDHGTKVLFADPASTERRLRAPVAPGLYDEVGIAEVANLAFDDPVEIVGPGILAFDGERQRSLEPGQRATMRVTRTGPHVIDPAAALHLAATGAFYLR